MHALQFGLSVNVNHHKLAILRVGEIRFESFFIGSRITPVTAYFNFVNRIALGLGVGFSAEEVEGYKV